MTHAGPVELVREEARRREIVQVVERERLALKLVDERQQMCPCATLRVERGALVGVLTVREVESPFERRNERLRERFVALEPPRDRGFVRGRARERDRRKASTLLHRERSLSGPKLVENPVVVLGAGDDCDRGEALRRRAHERGTTDVDHLDETGFVELGTIDCELERVQVDAHEVERLDAMLLEHREILRKPAPGEDSRVDSRVERLHAPAEHLGKARDVLDLRHRKSSLLECLRRAPARDELVAEIHEPLRERRETRLVVDGDQRAHSSLTTFGSRRCSASCTRSRRDSTVSPSSTGTGSDAMTGPVSTPSST